MNETVHVPSTKIYDYFRGLKYLRKLTSIKKTCSFIFSFSNKITYPLCKYLLRNKKINQPILVNLKEEIFGRCWQNKYSQSAIVALSPAVWPTFPCQALEFKRDLWPICPKFVPFCLLQILITIYLSLNANLCFCAIFLSLFYIYLDFCHL